MIRDSTVRKVTVFYSPGAKDILKRKTPEQVPGVVQLHVFIAAVSMRCACNQPFLYEDHPMLLLLPPHPRKYLISGYSESNYLDRAIQEAARVEIHVTAGHAEEWLLVEVEFFRMARELIYAMRLNIDPTGEMRVPFQSITPHLV